ncbi:MAG: VanW family protein, partial [Fimbriimonadaceae bacterium]|nr:VanW family protein [Fimbriimonadaceae bacterium]
RHRFAPGYCPPGRDAAVAFGGIDLKLKNPYDFRVSIRAEMKRSGLVVSLIGPKKVDRKVLLSSEIVRFVSPREYKIEGSGPVNRVRNSGKPGYEVMTYRTIDGRQELVSVDSYPPFHRILETKGR